MEQIIKHKNQWIDLDSIVSISDSKMIDELGYSDYSDYSHLYVVYYIYFKYAMYPGSSDNPLCLSIERKLVRCDGEFDEAYKYKGFDIFETNFKYLIQDGFEFFYGKHIVPNIISIDKKPICEINFDKERDILLKQWIEWKKFKNK